MLKDYFHDKRFIIAVVAAPIFMVFATTVDPPHHVGMNWFIDHVRDLLLLVVLYPILEEWVFRGLIQEYLLQKDWGQNHKWGFTLANGITSIIFTVLHFINHPPLLAVAVFIPSLVFGYFRDRFNSVTPGILLHIFYNFTYFVTYRPL